MMKPVKKNLGRSVCAVLMAMLLVCAFMAPAMAEMTEITAMVGETAPPSSSGDGSGVTGGTGAPYVTAYTVTDGAGNEIQRIKENQKCRIIVAVVDPRITSASQLTLADGRPLEVNVKVVSTSTFASPSLGDITTTTLTPEKVDSSGLHYSVILNDITYLGGTSNELSLDIAYNDNGRALATITQGISQCGVSSTDKNNAKSAALVVKSASYGAGDVTAGNNFTLSAVVLCSGGTTGSENVAVSLKLPEEITVVSGSSDFFIGNMAAGASQQVDFLLTASAVAKAGSYNITLDVTGNAASDGAALAATKNVTVPVVQPDRFEISNVNISENMVVGEENYGSVNLVNKGKSSVYNVEAELQGEGFTVDEGAKKFIGNVASGSQSSQDFSVTATQGGTINATLVVTYEDEKGTIKTLTKDIIITADEMNMGGGDMMPGGDIGGMEIPQETSKGIPGWLWAVIAVVVVGAGAGITLGVVKKKKKQRAAAKLMEDDDEDI